MDIIDEVLGGTSDAALFGTNIAPTIDEITAAQRDAKVYGEAAERLVSKVGLRRGHYASEQPIFAPLLRLLTLAGWSFGGSGFFSVVFYKGGLAIKISLRGSGDAALDYLEWAKNKSHMPGVPVVYGLEQHDHTYVALMERYESARLVLNRNNEDFCEQTRAEYEDIKAALEQGAAPDFTSGDTALAIRDELGERGSFDLHFGNVMLDRAGQLIITDPLGRSDEHDTDYGGTYYYSYSQAA